MAIEKLETQPGRAWALWKITESEQELVERNTLYDPVPEGMIHPQKRLEFLGARALTAALAEKTGITYRGIVKDKFGKPSLRGYTHALSLSHSYPYVAVIIDESQPVGIDLEQPKEKLLRIASRILRPEELENCGMDIIKHCVYWCAKETMVKIHGKKDLIFAENLLVEPFSLKNEGDITGKIIVTDKQMMVPLYYQVQSDFVLVFNKHA